MRRLYQCRSFWYLHLPHYSTCLGILTPVPGVLVAPCPCSGVPYTPDRTRRPYLPNPVSWGGRVLFLQCAASGTCSLSPFGPEARYLTHSGSILYARTPRQVPVK